MWDILRQLDFLDVGETTAGLFYGGAKCPAMFLWLGVPEHTWNLEVQKKQTEEVQNLLLLANPRI